MAAALSKSYTGTHTPCLNLSLSLALSRSLSLSHSGIIHTYIRLLDEESAGLLSELDFVDKQVLFEPLSQSSQPPHDLSLSLSLSLCLSVSLSVCLSLSRSLSVCLSPLALFMIPPSPDPLARSLPPSFLTTGLC